MSKRLAGAVVLLLPALGLGGTALGQTSVQLGPAADVFVTSGTPDSNYGGAGGLSVSAGKSNGQLTSLLRFNLASAKATFDSTYGAG